MADDPFVPIDKVAQHFSVSISTVRAWVRQGRIPKDTFIKLGNTYRFSIPAVTAALTSVSETAEAPRTEDTTGTDSDL